MWRQIDFFFLSYIAHFFLEWEMLKTKFVEKKLILHSVTFFETRALMR
jgi:hypothetical protein